MSDSQQVPTDPGDRILTSLAILKANWDEGQRSYLDNFLPFIADCMNACGADEVTVAGLSSQMRDRFGIPLPDGVIQTLLKKASRQGLGTRSHGRFSIDRVAVAKFDLTHQRSDAMRREEASLNAWSASPRSTTTWNSAVKPPRRPSLSTSSSTPLRS